MITYKSGTTLTTCTPKDARFNENNGNIFITDTTLPSFRYINSNTLVPINTGTCLAAPAGCCLINQLSAVINSTSQSTIDFVELSTGFRQNYAGGSATTSFTTKGQWIDSDPTLGIALGGCSTSGSLVKVNGNTFSVTTISSLPVLSNETIITVILKGPPGSGRWLLGTNSGSIYEVDQFGTFKDQFLMTQQTIDRLTGSQFAASNLMPIYNLAYDNNILIVTSSNIIWVMDWSTKTILNQYSPLGTATVTPFSICHGASGETLASRGAYGGTQGVIGEMDMTVQPLTFRDNLYLSSATGSAITAMSSSYSTGFSLDTGGTIRTFTLSARPTTLRTITLSSAASGGGTQFQGRLTIVNDTGGVTTSFIELDTFMQSPAIYRVHSGQTLMEITEVGSGSTASFDVSRYNS